MKNDEHFLNARQAAVHVGYEPGQRNARGQDPAMRCFYAFVKRHGIVAHRDGRRLLFQRADLDRAVNTSGDEHTDRLRRAEALGREAAREDFRM